jgi:hypothetical protein
MASSGQPARDFKRAAVTTSVGSRLPLVFGCHGGTARFFYERPRPSRLKLVRLTMETRTGTSLSPHGRSPGVALRCPGTNIPSPTTCCDLVVSVGYRGGREGWPFKPFFTPFALPPFFKHLAFAHLGRLSGRFFFRTDTVAARIKIGKLADKRGQLVLSRPGPGQTGERAACFYDSKNNGFSRFV